jgi:hypothetical protein
MSFWDIWIICLTIQIIHQKKRPSVDDLFLSFFLEFHTDPCPVITTNIVELKISR